jgi:hypothetical protein
MKNNSIDTIASPSAIINPYALAIVSTKDPEAITRNDIYTSTKNHPPRENANRSDTLKQIFPHL